MSTGTPSKRVADIGTAPGRGRRGQRPRVPRVAGRTGRVANSISPGVWQTEIGRTHRRGQGAAVRRGRLERLAKPDNRTMVYSRGSGETVAVRKAQLSVWESRDEILRASPDRGASARFRPSLCRRAGRGRPMPTARIVHLITSGGHAARIGGTFTSSPRRRSERVDINRRRSEHASSAPPAIRERYSERFDLELEDAAAARVLSHGGRSSRARQPLWLRQCEMRFRSSATA